MTSTLASANIFVGNGSNLATGVALSGDATISNTGALTLAGSGVTAAQYGNTVGTIPSVTVDAKGRITAASSRTIVDNDIPDNITASNYLPLAGGTMTGKLNSLASSTSSAGLNLPHGIAPTTPVNGDLWTTTLGVFARINGVTAGPFENALTFSAPLSRSTNTISIPVATSSVNGYLSSANFTTFTNKLNLSGGTLTGKLNTMTPTTSTAGLTLPHGAAPTSPVNGDIWTTTTGIYSRINGSTIGPLTSASNVFVQNGNSFGATASLGTNDANGLAIETNNTERMRILSGGNVGIATTNPAANLDVNGSFKLGANCPVLGGIIKTSVTVTDATAFDYNTSRSETLTVTGAAVNATVIVNPRQALPGTLGVGYSYVSAANTVIINITNSGTSTALGTVVFDITIIQ
jgi:hypothetical protein